MAVSSTGTYWIVLAGRGTGQTATLHYQAAKPAVQNTYESTDVLGPYNGLASAEAELKKLTITGSVTVVNASSQILGSVNISTGAASSSPAVNGSSEPSNPTQAIQLEGGNVAPNLPNLPNPLAWEQSLANFFNALSQKNTWIRVAKVVVGGSLLIFGIAHITGSDHVIAQTARRLPLPI